MTFSENFTRLAASWVIASSIAALACGPVMIEREGHRVFNPAYRHFLDAPERESWQQPERVLSALSISEGFVVADIGAGTGYFTKRLAERVGSCGLVYATDVQEKMINELRSLVQKRDLENVVVIHAGFDDPQLPANCCDLVLFANVYKEIDDRVLYMQKVKRALKPNGRVVILGFRPDAPGRGPPRDARLSAHQVVRELSEAGFTLRESHEFLPRQYFLVVVRRDG